MTQNRMILNALLTENGSIDTNGLSFLSEEFHELVEFGVLASSIDPFDPMERSLLEFGKSYLQNTEHLHYSWTLEQEYTLSEQLLAMTHIWKPENSDRYILAAKGSAEAIFDLCHLTKEKQKALLEKVDDLAKKGLRVIAVAKGSFIGEEIPANQHDFDFNFVGLLGFHDALRPSVPHSLKECYEAGIRVIMITGDYPITAIEIAKGAGLNSPEKYLSGPDLNKMSDEELSEKIKSVNIFARVFPEQKLRIVEILKKQQEVVAMTGDGINDAPALKSAHIGIAMGKRGTDVARESADLVLLDDDFSSIVMAIRIGRRIFDNLQKAVSYLFAVHIPIAGLCLIPLFFKMPMILLPIHIVFLELIINPACSIVFENEEEEKNIMRRPPQRKKELLPRKNLIFSLLNGIGILLFLLTAFIYSLKNNIPLNEMRTILFSSMIFVNLSQIMLSLSKTHSIWHVFKAKKLSFWIVTSMAIFCLFLATSLPYLQRIFHFSSISPKNLIIPVVVSVASLIWLEILKFFQCLKT